MGGGVNFPPEPPGILGPAHHLPLLVGRLEAPLLLGGFFRHEPMTNMKISNLPFLFQKIVESQLFACVLRHWSLGAFRHTFLEAMTTRGVGGFKESSKLAVWTSRAVIQIAPTELPGSAVGGAGGRLPVQGGLCVRISSLKGGTFRQNFFTGFRCGTKPRQASTLPRLLHLQPPPFSQPHSQAHTIKGHTACFHCGGQKNQGTNMCPVKFCQRDPKTLSVLHIERHITVILETNGGRFEVTVLDQSLSPNNIVFKNCLIATDRLFLKSSGTTVSLKTESNCFFGNFGTQLFFDHLGDRTVCEKCRDTE